MTERVVSGRTHEVAKRKMKTRIAPKFYRNSREFNVWSFRSKMTKFNYIRCPFVVEKRPIKRKPSKSTVDGDGNSNCFNAQCPVRSFVVQCPVQHRKSATSKAAGKGRAADIGTHRKPRLNERQATGKGPAGTIRRQIQLPQSIPPSILVSYHYR